MPASRQVLGEIKSEIREGEVSLGGNNHFRGGARTMAEGVKEGRVQMNIFIPNHVPVTAGNSGWIVGDHVFPYSAKQLRRCRIIPSRGRPEPGKTSATPVIISLLRKIPTISRRFLWKRDDQHRPVHANPSIPFIFIFLSIFLREFLHRVYRGSSDQISRLILNPAFYAIVFSVTLESIRTLCEF